MAPEYRRADIKGGTYFFTVNTFRRQPNSAKVAEEYSRVCCPATLSRTGISGEFGWMR
ncbi:MAG: hypothetical protein ACREUD_03910 [Gammaproteobacteria bacterium]